MALESSKAELKLRISSERDKHEKDIIAKEKQFQNQLVMETDAMRSKWRSEWFTREEGFRKEWNEREGKWAEVGCMNAVFSYCVSFRNREFFVQILKRLATPK